MQVYRGMDIGTAKAPGTVRKLIPHRMVDIVDPSEEYTVKQFQSEGRNAIDEVVGDGGRVVIAGGSGLHFRALVDPMTFAPSDRGVREELEAKEPEQLRSQLLAHDPEAGAVVDLANPRRLIRALEVFALTGLTPSARATTDEARMIAAYEPLLPMAAFGIDPGDSLKERVSARFHGMLEAGLLQEVSSLDGTLGTTASQAVGYKELMPVVRGEVALETATEQAISATRALVKRQRTYFRRDPRIAWMSWQDGDFEATVAEIRERVAWTS